MNYIYTFHSHFFAIRFATMLKEKGIGAILMPVPRKVSSSCGTCAKIEIDFDPLTLIDDGVEQVYKILATENVQIYEAE